MTQKHQVTVPNKLLPSFNNLSQAIYDIVVWYGGRGSAKSQSLAAIGILESYIDDGVILCCREIQKSISDSVYSMLVSYIEDKGLDKDFKILNTSITNLKTGAEFIFAGLKSNITNIKSINKLRVVLVDEAENVSQNSWDILLPTPRYGDVRIYVVFNPRFEDDPTYQLFVANNDDRKLVTEIQYQDNPWFPPSLEKQRQRDAKGDAGRYAWIWQGKFLQITDASILAKKLTTREFDVDYTYGDPLIGIDWGFSNDPTAVIEAYVKDNSLYIRNAGSKVGLELDDTAEWLAKQVPIITKYASRADSARPETISKVKHDKDTPIKLIKACKKWPGSVEDGIAQLQSFDEIVIHPDADCCRAELTAYSFKTDKYDEITAIPLDKDDHYADALRYAIEPFIQRKGKQSYGGAGKRTY